MKWNTVSSYYQQDIKKSEYVRAAVKTIALMALISYAFYESAIAFLAALPMGVWHMRRWQKECIGQKRQEFQRQFLEAIQSISASLSVGYSLENAMREAKKEMSVLFDGKSAIHREFDYMLRQIHLQIPVEQIMTEWAERVEQEDVKNFAEVLTTAKKSGGNMIEIIRNSISQIRDKLEVKQEIETLLAARKYEFKVMSLIPFGIILYMKLSFGNFMGILYGNILGMAVMSVCLAIYISAYCLGERIVNIEV